MVAYIAILVVAYFAVLFTGIALGLWRSREDAMDAYQRGAQNERMIEAGRQELLHRVDREVTSWN